MGVVILRVEGRESGRQSIDIGTGIKAEGIHFIHLGKSLSVR